MPIRVFGSNSNNSENRVDTSIFVCKPHLKTNFIESTIEEDIVVLKNQSGIKFFFDTNSIREAASKKWVDKKFSNDIDFNDKNYKIQNSLKLTNNELQTVI